MVLFLIAFGVMVLAAGGMALGALAGRRPLRSGCGEAACELCGGDGDCPAEVPGTRGSP
jgi:hypothetical protein